ncbi:MAG: Branched-chain amino acid aminotransferase [Brockia lithotrophica]|uniref:Branched-chain-amino-acid aminotransferase n=1 Tax=Brockia lithotrophica TaxID=933949 RepID=A0A2T5G4H3_9BACL|nr:branched-chain-amino-acid transaminase [Brockia lithotrophica]PTQ51079.1 MAG: Branched-chain amino acid aminotransferase [Brockia lithotrophica]
MAWVFVDGDFVSKEEAKLSVYDHGLLYGDGVFEGIRAYEGKVFRLREHMERLYASARAILLEVPYPLEDFEEIVLETLRRNELATGYIRIVVTRGRGDLGLDPRSCPRASVVVVAEPLALFPRELYEKGIRLFTVAVRRPRQDILPPQVKSLNYLNNVYAKVQARRAGYDEALLLNTEGYVTEGSGENIFLVKDGVLLTPPPWVGILKGITRAAVLELANGRGIPAREEVLTLTDVYTADEVFLTGTAAEIVPVVEVDGRTIGTGKPGPITGELLEAFRELTRAEGVPVAPSARRA